MVLAERMLSNQKSKIMPIAVNFDTLITGGDDLGLCLINKASFRKFYKAMFNISKLKRAKSKHKDDVNDGNDEVPVQTRVGKIFF